jgi:predicted O-methyltransferase YrrM
MENSTWAAVDNYICEGLVPSDSALLAALRDSQSAGLPSINVTPNQGKLLQLLVQMHGATRILEIGTLGGYSTIWMARALPAGGRLITLEASAKHAEVARENIDRAGLSDRVEIRLGKASDSLRKLVHEGSQPFDFIFLDADKPGNPEYLEWSLRLSRPGTVIVCDNVIRDGEVIDSHSSDPAIQGMRRFFELVAQNPRLSATAIQTVGSKGYDGFSIAVVNS